MPEKRLDRIERKLDVLSDGVVTLAVKFDRMDDRVSTLERNMEAGYQQLDQKIEAGFQRLTNQLLSARKHSDSHQRRVERQSAGSRTADRRARAERHVFRTENSLSAGRA